MREAGDAARRQHLAERLADCDDVRRVPQRPAVHVVVGTDPEVGLRVAVMERHPGALTPEPAQRDEAVGLDVVGFDDVRAAGVDQVPQPFDDLLIVAMALDEELHRDSRRRRELAERVDTPGHSRRRGESARAPWPRLIRRLPSPRRGHSPARFWRRP